MSDLLDAPLSIAAVRVIGAHKTSSTFLDWVLKPHLKHDPNSTLRSVIETTGAISTSLNGSQLFKSLDAKIVPAQSGSENEVDVIVNVRERGWYFVKTATEVGNGEGSASLTARFTNLLGHADVFSLNTSIGTKTKRAFDASISCPVSPDMSSSASLAVIGTERELGTQGGGGTEEKVALRAVLNNSRRSQFASELAWRCIGSLSNDAPISIRQSAGPNIKASLSHTYAYDTLDDHVMPTTGSLFRITDELAITGKGDSFTPPPQPGVRPSPLGDIAFWKTEAETKWGFALTRNITASLTTRAGILSILAGDPGMTHYSDKFHLGGPLSVRAFSADGMGAREGASSVGGNLYYSLGLSMISNLPFRPEWPVKLHSWVNAGRVQSSHDGGFIPSIQTAVTQPSVSAGLGLIYRFDPIRVELNVGVPLVAAKGESLRRGVQVGIGLEFL